MRQLSKEEIGKLSFFDIISYLGAASIHPKGFIATKDLLRLAKIGTGKQILDVGCGTGNTACYLAGKMNCTVTGIDLSRQMIEKAKARAKENRINIRFKVADAQNLPFKDHSFDALIGESITAYLDKKRALAEYTRVTKPNGVIADMEFTWLKKPTKEVIRDTCKLLDTNIEILSAQEWKELFTAKGWNVEFQQYNMDMNLIYMLRKIMDQRLESLIILYKVLTNPHIKKKMGDVKRHFQKYADYIGYGIYVARKNETL